jgi:hypothetical protein
MKSDPNMIRVFDITALAPDSADPNAISAYFRFMELLDILKRLR